MKARHDPNDVDIADLPTIARIELTSWLTRSTFGDERLFFQHETIPRDAKKLKQQGEAGIARAKLWKSSVESHNTRRDGVWGETPVEPLPEDNDDAMDVIVAGIQGEMQCPFAWLLEAL